MAIASASATKTKALVLTSGFSTTAAIAAEPDWPSAYPAATAASPKAKLAAKNLLALSVVVVLVCATAAGADRAINMKAAAPSSKKGSLFMSGRASRAGAQLISVTRKIEEPDKSGRTPYSPSSFMICFGDIRASTPTAIAARSLTSNSRSFIKASA